MRILACADPLVPNTPDESFAVEIAAIKAAQIPVDLLDLESLLSGLTGRALRRVAPEDLGLVVYRGWMLGADQYTALAAALEERGGHLINDSAATSTPTTFPGGTRLWRVIPRRRSGWLESHRSTQPKSGRPSRRSATGRS